MQNRLHNSTLAGNVTFFTLFMIPLMFCSILKRLELLPDVLLEVPCFILTKRWCAHVRVMEAVWRPGWGRVLRANWLKLKIWRNTSDYYYLAYLKDYRQISVFNRSELVTKFLAIQKLYESNKLELKYSNYNLY